MRLRAFADLFLFLSGLALVFNECVFASGSYDTALIMMGAAMMGLPFMMAPMPRESEIKEEPKPEKVKINRNTDLRIAQRPPEHPAERQMRKDMEHLRRLDERAKLSA